MLNNGVHLNRIHNEAHHQMHNNGAYYQMWNNGAHPHMLNNGGFNRTFNLRFHHQTFTQELRSQGIHNLSYEERIELWNLENEQFMELIIQPSLHHQYFKRAPELTDRGLDWENIWPRLQQDARAYLQLLRMSMPCFIMFCDTLQKNYGLQPTLNMSIEESVAIFLRICGHNEVQRDVGLRFDRNQETVQRKFIEVLKATELLACHYIRTPTREHLGRIPERLIQDRRYWPYFSGFVGAMDGTHVCVKVKQELQGMYWDRHDNPSLNIMAICDLNMLFTYIWNGAPRSCHDTSVLTMAQQSDSEFPLLPPEKYYLVDSGYPNKQRFVAPYISSRNRVVRYHMAQFNFGPAPRNKQELIVVSK
ncbi:uncharacterized protein LOC112085436 [Eutrema salsugineum]|uniref:uncharacterized protein LOC112085436 n=1 Tax=Eutrema salsugineum TaxID=72664 RepID=UPI000CED0B13|nr:uncharacterized protein LOC112085436 [Eutrema salsugineum]